MTKDTLITSPQKKHKKNFKYFNYGCINLLDSIEPKNIIIDHPWNDLKKYHKDIIQIKKINLFILKKISTILNHHHGINKDLRYWKILIGPWLHCLVYTYYEKNIMIDKLLKYKKI